MVRSIRKLVPLAACLAILVVEDARQAEAGDGGSFAVTQPAKRGQRRSGLQIDYRGWGWTGSGYRQVEFVIRSVPTSKRERSITIEVAPNSFYRGNTPLAVRRSVTLPQGHTQSTVNILVPQNMGWSGMRVDVYEDDRLLEDVSMKMGNSGFQRNPNSGVLSEAYPTMLLIDAEAPPLAQQASRIGQLSLMSVDKLTYDLPDARSLAVFVHAYYNQNQNVQRVREMLLDPKQELKRGNDLETLQFIEQTAQVEIIQPSDLPDSWLGLTQVDVVFVSLDDLQLMLDRQDAKAQHLLEAVSAGTTLVVHGLGDAHARLGALNEALASRSPDGPSLDKPDWQEISATSRPDIPSSSSEVFSQITGLIDQNTTVVTTSTGLITTSTATTRGSTPSIPIQAPQAPTFLAAPLGLGTIVAVAGDEPFHGRIPEWHWLFAQLGPDRWMWHRRHGLSLHRENPDYWNFLIPGLGAAPVNTFLLLITGFVVVVGPVNYWLLRRSGRIHLLLATVPAAAGILTMGMLAYVVLHDGFATRLRARSLTHLDQQNGKAVTWARQSYYSGLAPTGGMSFPADTAVYPIHHRPVRAERQRRLLRWKDDQQLLEAGYHRSRALTQLMVIRPQSTAMRLIVRRMSETGELHVENQLGVPLARLVVCDEQGQLYQATELTTDGRSALMPCTADEVAAGLAPLVTATRPAVPDKFDIDYHTRSFLFNWSYSWSSDSSFEEPTQATSILEKGLAVPSFTRQPARREFWAWTTTAPSTMPTGIDAVRQVKGLHLIQGDW